MDIAGRTLYFVTRPAFVSRQRAQRLAARAAAVPGSGKPGPGSIAVFGLGGVVGRLAKGALLPQWERLRRRGVQPLSEIGFLRAVGLMPKPAAARLIAASDFMGMSGLDRETARSLAIAGALEPEGDQFPFGDLRLGREIARLLAAGYPLAGVAEAAAVMRRHAGAEMAAGEAEIAVRVRQSQIEISGQALLPFTEAPADLDQVMDEAEAAEDAGDTETARRLYEIAVMARPRDAVARYNLGCVLTALERLDEAEIQFAIAASLDPALAEACFNIAHVRRLKADAAGERRALEQALDADPAYVDALVALARWHIARDELSAVRPLLDRIAVVGAPDVQKDFVQRATLLCELSERLEGGPAAH